MTLDPQDPALINELRRVFPRVLGDPDSVEIVGIEKIRRGLVTVRCRMGDERFAMSFGFATGDKKKASRVAGLSRRDEGISAAG